MAYDRPVPRPLTLVEDREFHQWGMVTAAPHVSLRPHVRRYIGWWERRTTPLYRRELPTSEVPLIICFGEPIRLFEVADRFGTYPMGSPEGEPNVYPELVYRNEADPVSWLARAFGFQPTVQVPGPDGKPLTRKCALGTRRSC